MTFFESYRRVLARPGTAAFSASGFVARLQIAMITLGIVLLISARTGAYGVAGATSATYVVSFSLAAVAQGRLIDRLGQARVLLPAVVLLATGAGAFAVQRPHRARP